MRTGQARAIARPTSRPPGQNAGRKNESRGLKSFPTFLASGRMVPATRSETAADFPTVPIWDRPRLEHADRKASIVTSEEQIMSDDIPRTSSPIERPIGQGNPPGSKSNSLGQSLPSPL